MGGQNLIFKGPNDNSGSGNGLHGKKNWGNTNIVNVKWDWTRVLSSHMQAQSVHLIHWISCLELLHIMITVFDIFCPALVTNIFIETSYVGCQCQKHSRKQEVCIYKLRDTNHSHKMLYCSRISFLALELPQCCLLLFHATLTTTSLKFLAYLAQLGGEGHCFAWHVRVPFSFISYAIIIPLYT